MIRYQFRMATIHLLFLTISQRAEAHASMMMPTYWSVSFTVVISLFVISLKNEKIRMRACSQATVPQCGIIKHW